MKTQEKKNQIENNLKRQFKALRKQFGNTDAIREDFKQTIRFEMIKAGVCLSNDSQLYDKILNC